MIGDRLRIALDQNNMTQKDLAKKAHITESSVCRYLQNQRGVTDRTLRAICDVLDVSADWLIGREK